MAEGARARRKTSDPASAEGSKGTIDVHAGEVHAVIGPNGAGKTPLIAQLAGMWQNATPWPMMGFMLVASILSLGIYVAAQRGRRVAASAPVPAD